MSKKNKPRTKLMNVAGKKEQVVIEEDYRKSLLTVARSIGCEIELKQIFTKYDTALKNCKNEQEAKAIGALGVAEINRLLDNDYMGIGGSVSVNGETIVDDSKDRRDAGLDKNLTTGAEIKE